MSELLRHIAREIRNEAQTNPRNHVAAMVLVLCDDGSYETLCWTVPEMIDTAAHQLPLAAAEMAKTISSASRSRCCNTLN